MKVGNFLKMMCIVTFMAVLFIHLQVKIYDLAYQGKTREQAFQRLAEINGNVKNDILRLKSSNNIGRQLLAKDKQYQFLSKNHVVEVVEQHGAWPDIITASARSTTGFFSRVMSLAFSSSAASLSH